MLVIFCKGIYLNFHSRICVTWSRSCHSATVSWKAIKGVMDMVTSTKQNIRKICISVSQYFDIWCLWLNARCHYLPLSYMSVCMFVHIPSYKMTQSVASNLQNKCSIASIHQMQTFSASLSLCAGNSPVTCEFLAQRPVTRGFDVLFNLRLNKCLSKSSWGWRLRPLWRHRNVLYGTLSKLTLIVMLHCCFIAVVDMLSPYQV